MANQDVVAFLNKLINDERRWTAALEEEARALVAALQGAPPTAPPPSLADMQAGDGQELAAKKGRR